MLVRHLYYSLDSLLMFGNTLARRRNTALLNGQAFQAYYALAAPKSWDRCDPASHYGPRAAHQTTRQV
jgi:hypothetical protein